MRPTGARAVSVRPENSFKEEKTQDVYGILKLFLFTKHCDFDIIKDADAAPV